jgi:hypothetical protein
MNQQTATIAAMDLRPASYASATGLGLARLLAAMGAVRVHWPADEIFALQRDWKRALCRIEDACDGEPGAASSLLDWIFASREYANYRLVTRALVEHASDNADHVEQHYLSAV